MGHLAGKGKQRPIEVTGVNEKGETVTVKITPDMRVALYLHSKNYQNLRHIQRGGITVPQYEAYAYIAQRPLTPEQKDSLVHVASGSYNLKGTPW